MGEVRRTVPCPFLYYKLALTFLSKPTLFRRFGPLAPISITSFHRSDVFDVNVEKKIGLLFLDI